ncbi:bifunctional D-glycero-beta-D-manno-heptose-7-phosphate kinase/D-glycero-beta-D-manno-heptose 1-phosphate adenylyltransferase HldE [Ignatzschineria sp. RMDPL8A]|uniref:bifunctional D-glycero-beta-D-manno-heptose-7-phosphate kinase/D-glycero-beta-D-manno-heptose 1-phosphate adenylyltransferase HldE n=1 Tax=Ignatzschineria sp. RMDPL8A TaxID=2999236 RepID=UPI0016B4FE4E|nr:bifunctional D-glycero-beta-D-manno-heptose-7-phosphate kinase/D-glycero-beta-D-manno-heptose 1-phosphate adenylyltransferase HldE [Ignatzschineria sp. RMDPL8A]MDG9728938.1 bifunctional D-glycero-beta-D-manno-heptose-7-phosphate kinase/D-glycero-beta-D-manno-heptose 1-phosphate adenylyltransferase HldE [Ignatzschineria sp. RMDPL8A]NLD08465.1 bifunctional D-glycero-beta-D-manno-heptose-7-phosphate kinase/D-glycero-beta-D-manno-heptose 1-phosphate adenylyltransferase HldE [Xanthomonadaceae bacte
MPATKKIAVIGDVMLDCYWIGSTHRISPESPVPVVNIKTIEKKLGGAANVALNIQTLDQTVSLVGLIGDDDAGRDLKDLCQSAGIIDALITDSQHATINKLRVISRQQHVVRCDFEENYPDTPSKSTVDLCKKEIESADVIVLSDYGKGFLQPVSELIAHARAHGKKVIIDPKGDDFTKYRGSTLLTPNLSEFEKIAGTCHSDEELFEKAQTMRETLDLEALLITRSEKGMTLFEKDKEPITFSAQARDVFDVTGAGDTVIALIATFLAKDHSLPEACRIANLGASIVVGKMGASTVSYDELNRAMREASRAHHRILTKEELLEEIKIAHDRQEKIVMTNGCFDIIHKGHVSYLEAARRLGDRLIVALNSDASVKRIKGPERPIMDEESRASVLASLSSVDWVVLFDEDTPESLINELLPDILVKGSDYEVSDIKGAEAVLNNGGEVKLIDFIDGYSTTKAINKIKQLS